MPGFLNIAANKAGLVRNDKMEGRDYLVVPMVMMVEGVLNGSNGPLYYPAAELSKIPESWNHKPVVVYHPTMNGKSLSACDPKILTAQKIGVIMNTKFVKNKLKAEAWIEKERAALVDNRVLEAVTNNKVMELSTGLFTENEETEGEFNGKEYVAIARNYHPDHLAVLPDQVGACSVADGAGFLRTNASNLSKEQLTALDAVEKFLELKTNELSHNDLRQAIEALLNPARGMGGGWVYDVYDTFFVYSKADRYFQQDYKVDSKDAVSLVGVPVEVIKRVVFDPISLTKNKEGSMDKKKIVDSLIGNSAWVESDREFLMGLSDEQLTKVSEKVAPVEVKPATNVEVKPATNVEVKPATDVPSQPVIPVTMDQFISNAPAEIRDVLVDGINSHNERKAELIGVICANKRNVLSKEQLNGMALNQLKAIAAIAAPVEEPKKPVFSGLGQVATVANSAVVEEPLEAPVLNFGKDEAK